MTINETELTGKVALVTGGSRGIGRSIALALAAAGADIAINYRRQESEAVRVRSQVESSGHRCVTVQADVSAAVDVSRMIESVKRSLGAVSILVNNAGVASSRSIEELTEEDWDETMAVNLKSVFLVIQAVLPDMRSQK
jgi:3-oxoacyl-[acyl-carrier protein] reductase